MEQLQNLIDPVSSFLWGWLLIYVLLATGLYFSIRTRLVQFRRFGHLWCLVFSSRGGAQGGISSFRAGPAFYIERGLYDCCRLCLRLLLSTWQLRLCGCKPDIPGLRPCDIPGVPDSRFGSRHSFSRENIGYAPLRVVILQCGTLRFAQAVAVLHSCTRS